MSDARVLAERILVADDDRPTRFAISSMLKKADSRNCREVAWAEGKMTVVFACCPYARDAVIARQHVIRIILRAANLLLLVTPFLLNRFR